MGFLASALVAQSTIIAIVGFLFLWAAYSAAILWWRTGTLVHEAHRAQSIVESADGPRAFTSGFEAADRQLAGLGPLADPWSAFRDTLIIPDAQNPSPIIRSTLPPDSIFGLGLLRAVGLRPRYHAAMPGLLVGAGLLFTFFGLAVALGVAGAVVAGGDPVRSRYELHTLLDTASFKFITSLVGLFLSIAYTFFEMHGCGSSSRRSMASIRHFRRGYRLQHPHSCSMSQTGRFVDNPPS